MKELERIERGRRKTGGGGDEEGRGASTRDAQRRKEDRGDARRSSAH